MAKKILTLEKNQSLVKNLFNGDLVTINHHDYFYKGLKDVVEGGRKKKMVGFWSTSTDFKRYFNIEMLDHVLTQKTNNREDGFNW